MDKLFQDIAFALRTVARNPGFAATAIVTLSLGIGSNVAIFGLTNTMMFKTMPFPDAHELVMVYETTPDYFQIDLSAQNYRDFSRQQSTLAAMAMFDNDSFTLLSGGEPARIEGLRTTASFFDVLGIEPAAGRLFTEAEDRPGGDRVVLISHRLWRDRFGSDPQTLGSSISLQGELHTVIGIMPPDFNFPNNEELWTPLAMDYANEPRASHGFDAIARLAPGITLEQADAELSGIAAQLAAEYPESNEGFGTTIRSLREEEIGDERILVYVLSGVVGFVLLIACANVAGLMLARAGGRQREIAVRTALGAGRGRLVRQLLTESLMLAVVGGGIGMLLGALGSSLIIASFPPNVPTWLDFSFDGTVYGFTVAVTLITAVLFGFVPALRSSGGAPGASLQQSSRAMAGRGRSRLRAALVVAEVALAMILLIGAGLMMRAYVHLNTINPGFEVADLLTFRVSLPEPDYPENGDRVRFFDELLEEVAAVPGVTAAAGTTLLPVGSFSGTYFGIEGNESEGTGTLPVVTYATVSPGYIGTLGIPLLQGRAFRQGDGAEGSPEVLLVTREANDRFWPGESAVGKRVKFGPTGDPDSEWKTVIGVVDNIMQIGIGADDFPGVYVPYEQRPAAGLNLTIRLGAAPGDVMPAIRDRVWAIDPDLPVFNVMTMAERIAQQDWEQKLFTRIFGTFAIIALMLASVGLYGLISYSVAQRTAEIGVRMALGADRRSVIRMVVRQSIVLVGLGLGIGLVGAFGITGVLDSMLVGVSATDPLTFGTIFAVLVAVAATASYVPALRATRVDPVRALRE